MHIPLEYVYYLKNVSRGSNHVSTTPILFPSNMSPINSQSKDSMAIQVFHIYFFRISRDHQWSLNCNKKNSWQNSGNTCRIGVIQCQQVHKEDYVNAETPRSSALQAGKAVGYLFDRHKFKKSTNTIERSIDMWHPETWKKRHGTKQNTDRNFLYVSH